MNSRALLMAVLWGSHLVTLVWGCESENGIAPEQIGTYETAVFGTFRTIDASYSTGGTTFTPLYLDSTSYLRINKSDSSYSLRISGIRSGNLNVLYEDSGSVSLVNVVYHKGSGWTLSAWKGEIHFFPLIDLKHSPWYIQFTVADGYNFQLGAEKGGSSIYMAQNSYLIIRGWKTI